MSDFNIDITKEENDSISLKISSSGKLTNNNLAEAFARTIEKLVEKEEEKRELKLYFFILMCEYFVGHKLFLLNHYIVRWMLAYSILKKNINEKVKKLSDLINRRL